MPGGLIQLVAQGPQDLYLTGLPQITYFKIVYRRHTNFAIENIELNFNGNVGFGRQASAEIQRTGDLITQTILKMTLPEVAYGGDFKNFRHVQFAWVRNVGIAAIAETEFEVGGTLIDKHYGDWLQVWHDLTTSADQRKGFDEMIGNTPDLTSLSSLDWVDDENNKAAVLKKSKTLYVPLQFYFCRNNGLALPLIALQYHPVRITVKFRPVDQLYIASDAFKAGRPNLALEEASLLVNYIFLENVERRRFAQYTHEYLIEQLQYNGDESISNSANGKYKITFNHPVKALFFMPRLGNYQGGKFMVYDDNNWDAAKERAAELLLLSQFDLDEFGYFNEIPETVREGDDYADSNGDLNTKYVAIDPTHNDHYGQFTFDHPDTEDAFGGKRKVLIGKLSDDSNLLSRGKNDLRNKIDGIVRVFSHQNDGNVNFYPRVERITRNDLNMRDLSTPTTKFDNDNRTPYVKKFDVNVWQHDNTGLLIDGTINPVTEVLLQINGQERQGRRSGDFYNRVTPFQAGLNTPRAGLGMYSFGFHPLEHQPSGTCNFSRIDTALLDIKFGHFSGPDGDIFINPTNKFQIMGFGYNIQRFISGMSGLAYNS
jgi:hypothetical protein